jgi:predicted amidohydrolase
MSASELRVALIQMPVGSNPWHNVQALEEGLARAASGDAPCELAVGVEFGISPGPPLPEKNEMYGYLGDMAARYGVYLLPGTAKIAADEAGGFYNQAPVFGPDGALLGRYNKMVPWDVGLERGTVPGREPLVFDIPEKGTRAGVMICFDADFPEIARDLTLSGAEVLIQLSMDPDTIPVEYGAIKQARAMENQAYYIYTNGVGEFEAFTLAGGSRIIGPESETLYSAGSDAAAGGAVLDLARLRRCRREGSWGQVRILGAHLEHLPPRQWAGAERESPLARRPPFGGKED